MASFDDVGDSDIDYLINKYRDVRLDVRNHFTKVEVVRYSSEYAYVNLYNKPKLMGWMMLDEPGKMVSANMSAKFGEFIKQLGKDFDRQTIMVTHNPNLLSIADNFITINKGGN